jgi:hypothetical protein
MIVNEGMTSCCITHPIQLLLLLLWECSGWDVGQSVVVVVAISSVWFTNYWNNSTTRFIVTQSQTNAVPQSCLHHANTIKALSPILSTLPVLISGLQALASDIVEYQEQQLVGNVEQHRFTPSTNQ